MRRCEGRRRSERGRPMMRRWRWAMVWRRSVMRRWTKRTLMSWGRTRRGLRSLVTSTATTNWLSSTISKASRGSFCETTTCGTLCHVGSLGLESLDLELTAMPTLLERSVAVQFGFFEFHFRACVIIMARLTQIIVRKVRCMETLSYNWSDETAIAGVAPVDELPHCLVLCFITIIFLLILSQICVIIPLFISGCWRRSDRAGISPLANRSDGYPGTSRLRSRGSFRNRQSLLQMRNGRREDTDKSIQ
mmetsp:Transcript_7704/g.21928  ORF Transcript_7704/g.21928 Transcript_7704/m.21928 type:complete len:248 (-) Transcript_7704:549-1292(-)